MTWLHPLLWGAMFSVLLRFALSPERAGASGPRVHALWMLPAWLGVLWHIALFPWNYALFLPKWLDPVVSIGWVLLSVRGWRLAAQGRRSAESAWNRAMAGLTFVFLVAFLTLLMPNDP